tara:strand:- start:161 stop:745 length:585 start_codon:yes stop_codon:yes gene_type:complete
MMNFHNRRNVEKKMRDSIRSDRAKIQVGKISTFGLLEMTRQRLREGFIRWETTLSIESFALKIIKKIEMLAFTGKVKYINANVPEKIKLYIDSLLKNEIEYFEKKYSFSISFIADPELIVPEYKITLINKSKKIINKIENINKIEGLKVEIKNKQTKTTNKLIESKVKVKVKDKVKKKKKKNELRTLWTRRKKK